MSTLITRLTIARIQALGPEGEMAAAELYRRAFDIVEPKGNWKAPIDSTLEPLGACFHPGVIVDAVAFMTGAPAEFSIRLGKWRFVAPGYYATVGA